MKFEEKVTFLRSLPLLKVSPISEIRAVAFAAKETQKTNKGNFILGKSGSTIIFLTSEDIRKITREYPDLEAKLRL